MSSTSDIITAVNGLVDRVDRLAAAYQALAAKVDTDGAQAAQDAAGAVAAVTAASDKIDALLPPSPANPEPVVAPMELSTDQELPPA